MLRTIQGALLQARQGAALRGLPLLGLALCALLAGAVPVRAGSQALEITGRPASAAFVAEAVGEPAAQALAPGGSARWGGIEVRNLHLPELPVEVLAFSDHPERVRSRGLLFHAGLLAFKPVRFQYYHEGGRKEGPLFLTVRLANRGRAPARVHLVQGAAGPDPVYFTAGHQNNRAFLRRLAAFEGIVARLAPGEVRQVALHELPVDQVVSGTAQMTLLEGSEVQYGLFAVHDPAEPVGFDLLSNPKDVHARGIYSAADQDLVRGWEIGPGEAFVAIGAVRQPNLLHGPELKGDYGVLYRVQLDLRNPGPEAERVEVAFNPRGGQATGNFLVRAEDGALQEWRAPDPVDAFQKVPLGVLEVPARSRRVWTLWTIPEGASNYPVRLVLRRESR